MSHVDYYDEDDVDSLYEGVDVESLEHEFDYPNIGKPDEIAKALGKMLVYGEYDRSWPEPSQYIQPFKDFFSEFAIQQAIKALFENSIVINGTDRVIVGYSADEIRMLNKDGTTETFVRVVND